MFEEVCAGRCVSGYFNVGSPILRGWVCEDERSREPHNKPLPFPDLWTRPLNTSPDTHAVAWNFRWGGDALPSLLRPVGQEALERKGTGSGGQRWSTWLHAWRPGPDLHTRTGEWWLDTSRGRLFLERCRDFAPSASQVVRSVCFCFGGPGSLPARPVDEGPQRPSAELTQGKAPWSTSADLPH